jgi:hypothetical protein
MRASRLYLMYQVKGGTLYLPQLFFTNRFLNKSKSAAMMR